MALPRHCAAIADCPALLVRRLLRLQMRLALVLAVVLLSACAVSAASVSDALTSMHDDMPAMSEAVFAAATNVEHDMAEHDEDAKFFLELATHVDDAAE